MIPRKSFVCTDCGKVADKTICNYHKQLKRIGRPLCADCAKLVGILKTRQIINEKYPIKSTTTVALRCDGCGKIRYVQDRQRREGFKCISCAAKENRINNKDLYDKLAKERINNSLFSASVSRGLLDVPLPIREERSKIAHDKRWSNNLDDRKLSFIEQSNNLYKYKYDYSLVNYINYTTPVIIICKDHGKFSRTPKQHARDGYGCPRCSELRVISSGHQEIAEFLTLLDKSICLQHNVRTLIKPYEVDIWAPDYNLAIEHHGIYWHSYNSLEHTNERLLHKLKADMARDNGIRLIQIFETEWLQKNDIVKDIIRSKMGYTNKIAARKCKIRILSVNEYKDFMNNYHLQGYKNASYKIGLYYQNELIMAIGISKHHAESFELSRLAAKIGYTIIGGISKLLSRAIKDLHLSQLLSYADRRYSEGNGYTQCGFEHVVDTLPNYFYTTGNKLAPLHARQLFQKHKLQSCLKQFDPNLSEAENMFNNGYRRLWDAGHMKFVKRIKTCHK